MTSRKSGPSWFQDSFGFAELKYYSRTKQQFSFQDGILTSKANGRAFYVGPFETPSVLDLQQQHSVLSTDANAGGGVTFQNIVGHPFHLHLREENANAVFQASSQFNCLAPADPQMAPDFGITRYCKSGEQASECAMACPAATAFRNYMVGQAGQGGSGKQLDCLAGVAEVVGNDTHMYWKMQNGFCLPDSGGIANLSRKLAADPELLEQAKGTLRVGLHRETEVVGCQSRVCQVLCAAVPLTGIKGMQESAEDWEVFARAMLDATYDAAFCVAAILAAERQARVKLFLTTIGLGRGCHTRWIVHAINSALDKYSTAPLDVMLVHYNTVPVNFTVLAEGTNLHAVDGQASSQPDNEGMGESGTREKLMAAFGSFDVNGDGVIDKEEFRTALQRLDPKFFTGETVEALFQAADASREGVVHYPEFVAWLSAQKGEVVHRVIEEDPGPDDAANKHLDGAAVDRARALCIEWDADKDGAITKPELYRALRQEFPDTLSSDLDDIVDQADLNGDGIVQFEEFLNWMLLPQEAKVSFEDNIRQALFVDPQPDGEGNGELLGSFAEQSTWEDGFLKSFVNQLLDRFSTSSEAQPHNNGGADPENSVTVHVDLARRPARQRPGDASIIRATAQSLGSVHGEQEELLKVLKVLSDEYGRIFNEFCEHILSKPQGDSRLTLHCPIIPICDMRNHILKQTPARVWSAIALAMAGLNLRQREALNDANIMMYIGDCQATLVEFREALQSKLQDCEEVCRPPRKGLLTQINGTHTWIRKDNTAEARLLRLQTFVQNQHIICSGQYSVPSSQGDAQAPQVPLCGVAEMVSQTHVFLASQASPGGRGAARMRVVVPHECDIGAPGDMVPVMRIAQALAQQGHKVAAVNAASAYHVGGGVASGGRHALEEAWCSQSTLFQSLISVESEAHESKRGGNSLHQHVPTTGVIVSPGVELFRDGTNNGYALMDEPTKLTCVVSVAMFNRNPSVSDSPLDSPSDVQEYVAQTCQKLEAMVAGAVGCGATALAVPDVGCGVFMNDAALVGSCLASVLRGYSADFDMVVISAVKPEFMQAVKHVLERNWSSDAEVNDYLRQLATDAASPQKPVCVYGQRCRSLWNKAHTDKYSHPASASSAKSGVAAAAAAHAPAGMGHSGRAPPAEASQVVAGKDKPICRHGEGCYQKNPQHFRDFRHPWLDGTETPEERQARLDETLAHKILDDAKQENWPTVFRDLGTKSDMVNTLPSCRSFALIHYAAYQKNAGVISNLVQVFHADPSLKTRSGETVTELFRQATREIRARDDKEEWYDRKVLIWLQRLENVAAGDASLGESFGHHDCAPRSGNGQGGRQSQHGGVQGGYHGQHGGGHQGQEGLDHLVVTCPTHEHFAGEYEEEDEEYNGEPVYTQKAGASSNRYHIYFSRNEMWGWVINNVPTTGQVLDKRPSAYMGESTRRRKPWDLYAGEAWKIFTPGPGGGRFSKSVGHLSVRRKPR